MNTHNDHETSHEIENNCELCESCGQLFPSEELILFDHAVLCLNCLESRTLLCADCGDRIWREDNAGDDEMPLCQSCYDEYYYSCSQCGRIIHEDDAHMVRDMPLCNACYHSSRVIQDYSYKPSPIFYGKGGRFFGVELEMDEGGEDNENAIELLSIANRLGELAYCKHDGSLMNGFELVTHPMTLDFHRSQMPWKEILHRAVSLGYRSHQAQTCGLHIHVNRTTFGRSEEMQDACIARVLYFFEKHWEELLKFSRRTPRQLERWAARYGLRDQPCEILDHAKKGYQYDHNGRYTCVNLQNHNTIEFRIFRGTLKFNTLIATLQLVNQVCNLAFFLSDWELKAMSWTTFVSGCTSPELVQYLKERQLYINEPVETEEEV